MREIKFRGKRVDTKEWIYGYLAEFVNYLDGDGKYGIQVTKQVSSSFDRMIPAWETELVEVIPETVGQFTGLHDKNGKEIYEGDVISLDCYSYEEPEDEYCGEVVYSNHLSSFCLRNCEQSDGWIPICELGGSYTTITTLCGNIHDNPELLKEVTDEA